MKYVKGLDTIRAVAVLVVILGHWGPSLDPNTRAGRAVDTLIQNGRFGVVLFFVLSGFLITGILLNEKVKNTAGKHFTIIKNFFVRRALRIFPIYYAVVILFFLIGDPFVRSHIGYFLTYSSNLPPYWTDQPNILSHTWSLSVEEQFYLMWPWFIILVDMKYIRYILWAAIAIGIGSKYYVLFVQHHQFPVLVFNCFDSFGIGALYAYARLDEERCRRFERGFVVIFILFMFFLLRTASLAGAPVFVILSRTFDSLIGLAAIMYVFKNRSEWVRRYILENRVLMFIGKISYGVYLYHFIIDAPFTNLIRSVAAGSSALAPVLLNPVVLYCSKFGALILLCWLSYRFFEVPIMSLKKRFEYSKE